jgi:hypothetical protein
VYPQSIPLGEEERAKLDALIARHDALTAEHGEEAYLRVGMLPFDS